jgi:hypothetical protein
VIEIIINFAETGPVQVLPIDLVRRKVERVCLRTPPIHECHQRSGVHQRQIAGDEPSKWQEPRMIYERLVPLIPHHGVVRVDPEQLQTLSNTTTVEKTLSPYT